MSLVQILIILVVLYLVFEVYRYYKFHTSTLPNYDLRIHVNGIRGKSSVTRLIAAVLRESGRKTLAKTTGTAARLIDSEGNDNPIIRKEANVSEQIKYLRDYSDEGYSSVVFECMAVNPKYQKFLEDRVIKAHIGIITNVREDHVDQMGETLEEIARSLASTIPTDGILITAETRPELLTILAEEAHAKNSRVIVANADKVQKSWLGKFKHVEFPDNIAIALEVAKLIDIPQKTALKAMFKAQPDPGAFSVVDKKVTGKKIRWANLFAINDRESFISAIDRLEPQIQDLPTAVILNNRRDRPDRVNQFAEIVSKDVPFDYVIAMGEYENEVVQEVQKNNPNAKIINLGVSSDDSGNGEELLSKIVKMIKQPSFFLVGAVNIHTSQSKKLLQVLQ